MPNKDEMLASGCTWRQIDYWTRSGWLYCRDNPISDRPAVTPGSGRRRTWLVGEDDVAALVLRLIHADINVVTAFKIARTIVDGEALRYLSNVSMPTHEVDLAEGITIRVTYCSRQDAPSEEAIVVVEPLGGATLEA